MSMNIYIFAQRPITFKKKDGTVGIDAQTVDFKCWQTPTKVSYAIAASEDPVQCYVDWITAERSTDAEFKIYAEDDLFHERAHVGIEIHNYGKEHINEFREWVTKVEEDGYTVKFEIV